MGIDRYVYAANDTTWVATFMERIEKQSKGYNAVSLSNYDATGVCVITDGSTFEVAGSMYLCTTDTSITASCATGVCYIMATGATATASVAWSTAAPTWRDDLQGYYASAASAVRALGGCAFTGSASYNGKWVYGKNDSVEHSYGSKVSRHKVIYFSAWNMDTTSAKTVAHGLEANKIRTITALVRKNDEALNYMLDCDNGGFIYHDNGLNVVLNRLATGLFDNADYNAADGWVTVWYEG